MKKLLSWPVFLILQLLSSILLIVYIYNLGVLPIKYLAVAAGVLLVLCLFTLLLMKPKNKVETAKNLIGKIISILLSIVMVIGAMYINRGNRAISSISDVNIQTNSLIAIVLYDSPYEALEDLKDKIFGTSSANDQYLPQAITEAQKVIGEINTKDYLDFDSLAASLYNEEIDVILMDEAYRTIVETKYETFEDDTRIIWQYNYDKEIEDFSKDVSVTNSTFTVYLSGIDTKGKVSTVSRSDVNMLVTVNPVTKQILMTSIPRDCYVTLANMGKKDKLTHAGIFGVENSVKTLEGLMGIDINYYAKVNFTTLIKIVDVLGGIEVYSDMNLKLGDFTYKKGMNHMNGEEALRFARERHSYSNGDHHRVQNQQEVLKGMINKMISPAIITNYSDILSAIEGCFETNMSADEITSLIQMQIDDMSSWEILQVQISGKGKTMTGGAMMPNNKLYYLIPNDDSIKQCKSYIEKMINGEKITIE